MDRHSTYHSKILVIHIIEDPDPSCFIFGDTKLGSGDGPVSQRCELVNTTDADILCRYAQYCIRCEGIIMNSRRHNLKENERE